MIEPAIPHDEFQRLHTLRSLNILDTAPDEHFERVVRLARRVFGVPIVLVSLVDRDRVWFKSRYGFERQEMPRSGFFCGHAILDDRVMVVADTAADERFAGDPLVALGPGIRFYAGYPLSAPDGSKIGTLCIMDYAPRELSRDDLFCLHELGRMVEKEIEEIAHTTRDRLTGVLNRRGFSSFGARTLEVADRLKNPVSLLCFKLANIGQIARDCGEEEAERVIIEFAQILIATFRDCDVLGRTSEDVFCVLLAGADAAAVKQAQYRLHESLRRYNLHADQLEKLDVTEEVLDYCPVRGSHCIDELLRHAEERVYLQTELAERSEVGSVEVFSR